MNPGTMRDSLIALDGLLELQPPGEGRPTMIITDQASYSDQVFGLYWLLGHQFSPRPAVERRLISGRARVVALL